MEEQEKFQRKMIRKEAGNVGWKLILYAVIFYFMIILQYIIVGVGIIIKYPSATESDYIYEQITEQCAASGVFYLLAVGLGILILCGLFRKSVPAKTLFHREKQMNPLLFLQIFLVFMGWQIVAIGGGTLLEGGLNLIGYTAAASEEAASSVSTTVSMFLYASFAGPIVEEIIYRGFVLRSFEKYGKKAAILLSALLFGVMHGNLPQGIFAFGIGLILGYVAEEYSIWWTILLHIINNCVFGDLLSYLFQALKLSEAMQNNITTGILVAFGVLGVGVLWKNRESIKAFFKDNRTKSGVYKSIFTAVGLLLFIGMELTVAITSLERI